MVDLRACAQVQTDWSGIRPGFASYPLFGGLGGDDERGGETLVEGKDVFDAGRLLRNGSGAVTAVQLLVRREGECSRPEATVGG